MAAFRRTREGLSSLKKPETVQTFSMAAHKSNLSVTRRPSFAAESPALRDASGHIERRKKSRRARLTRKTRLASGRVAAESPLNCRAVNSRPAPGQALRRRAASSRGSNPPAASETVAGSGTWSTTNEKLLPRASVRLLTVWPTSTRE